MTTLQKEALQAIRDLAGDQTDLLGQVVRLYFDSAPPLINQLKAACDASDLNAVRMAAHTLKSSSRNLGALDLAQMCAKLEAAARAGSIGPEAPSAADIEQEYERVQAALAAEVGIEVE